MQLVFSTMLYNAFRDGEVGVGIRYCTEEKLFNYRRLQAKTKVSDVLDAEDCDLNTVSKAELQCIVDKFSNSCTRFGLTISTKKT